MKKKSLIMSNFLPATGNPYKYVADLEKFIFDINASTGYAGKFDIVCHSMGALADLIDSKRLLYSLIKPLIYLYFRDIGSSGGKHAHL